MNKAIDYEQYARRDVDEIPKKSLSLVSRLASELAQTEARLAKLGDEVKRMTELRDDLAQKRLPAAMEDIGLLELKLADGSEISIGTEYHTKIPEKHQQAAFQWLRNNGFDSLIKNQLTAVFGKGEDERAKEFYQLAVERDIMLRAKMDVHPQTLKAFVKEQAEAGHPVPDDLFGVYVITQAHIRRP